MPLQELQKSLSALREDVAGIKPLVQQIPEVATAMSKVAEITAKLENNMEDHKRIHYRITGVEDEVKGLKQKFDTMENEHLVHMTTIQVKRQTARTSIWTRIKSRATDKAVEIATLAIVTFAAWMIISHLPQYPKTAPIINQSITRPVAGK